MNEINEIIATLAAAGWLVLGTAATYVVVSAIRIVRESPLRKRGTGV